MASSNRPNRSRRPSRRQSSPSQKSPSKQKRSPRQQRPVAGRSGRGRGAGRGGASASPGPGPDSRGRRSDLGGEQVEGRQAVRELLLAGRRRTRTVMIAEGLEQAPILDDIIELAREQRAAVREVPRRELEAAARSDAPQGVVALADPLPSKELSDLARPLPPAHGSAERAPFLLVLDGITDPGNFGAVLRTAECAGVSGVVLPRHRAARVTATAAKAAAGAVEHLDFAVVPGIPAALRDLSSHDVWTVGLDPAAPRPLHELDLASEAVALVLGAEGRGLSRLASERCDVLASIPLRGALGSLNVAAAAAVACFDIARRR
ncbi:MAG: 23S rRNA (guanosine(2251)-2'-O)-methyltransferase RlmB [Acidimicrobiaceae bacterium]|nr:23S rRNA (guanosine(2251)-2'-O)-methyltransferase RlmB [Acidimicrobiaceae bacterium]MCY4293321.1 23S rRNA (guanosine(2251)-2'-O)-methyltransferase RlmB [Acidimicrobiaceae bacterium]